MANKYKDDARKVKVREGEIVLTYGVQFLNNPEIKPHRHNQARPYLVLHREESGKFKALKMTSKIGGYMAEFKVNPKYYEPSPVLTKLASADTRFIYDLEETDVIQNGFLLTEKDMDNLYSRIVNLYCLNESEVKEEQIRIIFEKYMNNRQINIGTVIRVPYRAEYLFVINVTEKGYTCIPLYREANENTHGKVKLFKEESYIDFDEQYNVDKEDICYILRFSSPEEINNYIIGRVNSRKRFHENNNYVKKNLISSKK